MHRFFRGRPALVLVLVLLEIAWLTAALEAGAEPTISPAQAMAVGRRIWRNECEGTIEGLTSWNVGEHFPSLGIGHFIWYPTGREEHFQESFPALLAFLRERGVKLPDWLAAAKGCPWPTRAAFLADRRSPRMRELRQLLAGTVALQAEFIARRLAAALPRLVAELPAAEAELITTRFQNLFVTPAGLYALMDYVNFKGEGVNPKERYAGQGWGLLQVLQGMSGAPRGQDAVREFAASAARVLERRVANAPAERRSIEAGFLPGWKKRLRTYSSGS